MNTELLFFFSALGAFNGLMLGLYFLLYARPKHISNYFLGSLLLAMSIRIGKSVFFYFNENLATFYIQLGLTGCMFIGPSLYYYIKSIISKKASVQDWKYHYFIFVFIALVLALFFNYDDYMFEWQQYIIRGIYYQWLLYIVATGFLLKETVKDYLSRSDKINSVEIWVLSIYIGNILVWLAYNTAHYTSYIVGAVSFSFIFYLLILLIFINKNQRSILFKIPPKYAAKKISADTAQQLIKQMNSVMIDDELYKIKDLKIAKVADRITVTPHKLSQVLNDNLGKSFNSYISEIRINQAKKAILTYDHYTLEGIGYECGFKSKSTFYAAFKKYAGVTPSVFKAQQLN